MNNLTVLNAHIGKTNVVDFDDFSEIALDTLEDIVQTIMPLCGPQALHELVIYKNLANQYLSNVFSNDGIHILKNIEYHNPIQTYIANYIRYIAERVEKAAADGTSTAIYVSSMLIIAAFQELRTMRKDLYNVATDPTTLERAIMRTTTDLSKDVELFLQSILKDVELLKIDIKRMDRSVQKNLIYKLAMVTSKGHRQLAQYAVELFIDLPEILYEHMTFKRSQVETQDDLIIDYPEHDAVISVRASSNTQYNSKLNTELLLDSCDIVLCPRLYGNVNSLITYLNERTQQTDDTVTPLVVLFTGGDPTEITKLETHVDKRYVTLCDYVAYHPVIASNPLELRTIRAITDPNKVSTINEEAEIHLLSNVRIRLYDKYIYLYDLFTSESVIHPHYTNSTVPFYNKLRYELEDRITTLRNSHNATTQNLEINEFIRIYRSLVGSKIPILTIGGSTVNHLSNINVVEDVLGVVSNAMKYGVVFDLLPKLIHLITHRSTYSPVYDNAWRNVFIRSLVEYCKLTYDDDNICEHQIKCSDKKLACVYYDPSHKTFKKSSKYIEPNIVVSSYRAIDETIKRLIETVPRLTCTDKVIVPDSVMDTNEEE